MRLTTKGRYAVTAMMDLALHEGKGPITLNDIAENQEISLSYLEQLFSKLRRSGLVRGLRGPGGGYRLARDAASISIADIITAVDENVDVTRCGGKKNCQDGERCLTHELWQQLGSRIQDFLAGVTLASFLEREGVSRIVRRQQGRHEVEVQRLRKTVA